MDISYEQHRLVIYQPPYQDNTTEQTLNGRKDTSAKHLLPLEGQVERLYLCVTCQNKGKPL